MNNKERDSVRRDFFVTSHLTILTVYTIFSVILIGESLLLGWEGWALILLAASVVLCWMLHIQQRLDEKMRIRIYSACILGASFFYGSHVTSTYDLGLLMCALFMIFIFSGMPAIITVAQITYYVVIAYDLYQLWKAGEVFDALVITRTLLHICIIFVVGYLARNIMRKWNSMIGESEQEIDKLTEATRRLNDFLANISHEIRTPINAIIGLTDVCIEKEKDADIGKDLVYVSEAGKRVGSQIGDILDYSEISTDSLVINNEDYMLSSLLNDLCVSLRPHMKPEVELIVDVDASVPAVLNSDVGKLKKILWHLIMNGLRYTKKGGVYVRITSVKLEYGINLCIMVRDTGVGMSPDELEMAFDGFYQSDSGRSRSTNGLGLGLTIVAGFVSALGGFVQIDGEKDKGTIVRVSIPQKVVDDSQCMSVDSKDKLTLGAFLHFEKFSDPNVREFYNSMVYNIVRGLHLKMHRVSNVEDLKRLTDNLSLTHLFVGEEEYLDNRDYIESIADKVLVAVVASKGVKLAADSRVSLMEKPFYCFPVINILNSTVSDKTEAEEHIALPEVKALVVDDEPMNLIVARNVLGRYGMDITTADSGEEAVNMCRKSDFDIIFMDHMMPRMDGVEAMKQIRRDMGSKSKMSPIVALTANALSSAKEMFFREGFDEFVAKPIDRAELERALKKVLPDKVVYDKAGCSEQVIPVSEAVKQKISKTESIGEEEYTDKAPEDDGEGADTMSRLRAIGVDTDMGLLYCQGDEEFYISMFDSFMEEAVDKKRELNEFLKAKDLKNYAITVHSVKSTSKMIGIMGLSEMARSMEEAAKNGDLEAVSRRAEELIGEYDSVLTTLKGILHDSFNGEVE